MHDHHRDAVFQISLARHGNAARRQQRVPHDHSGHDFLVVVVVKAAVVISEPVEGKIAHQMFQPHGHAGGPAQAFGSDGPGNGIGPRKGKTEEFPNPFFHAGDLVRRRLVHTLFQITHFDHLDRHAQLSTKHRRVSIHVEHALEGVPQKTQAGPAQAVDGLGSLRPFGNPGPGARIVVEHAEHHVEWRQAGPPQGIDNFRKGSAVIVLELIGRGRRGRVHSGCRLQPHQDEGCFGDLHNRQHDGGRHVRGDITKDQINLPRGEQLSGSPRGRNRIHQAGGNHLHAQSLEPGFKILPVALQPVAQSRKLRPVAIKTH